MVCAYASIAVRHEPIGEGSHAIAKYFTEKREVCDCGYPLWELLVCGDCAAWYLRDTSEPHLDESADDRGAEHTVYLEHTEDGLDEDT